MSSAAADTDPFDPLRDAILRGMAHALSNRVAALGGINSLADLGRPWTERLSKALQDEGKRLEDILRLMRLLPDDGRGEPGAVELQPLIPDAIALHAYSSALLQVECTAAYDRETMPIYANRPRLVRSLLLVIDAAKRHAKSRGGRVAISYGGDSDRVTIRVATEPSSAPALIAVPPNGDGATTAPDVAATEAAFRAALERIAGAPPVEVSAAAGELRIAVTVPTLAAGRRGERFTAVPRPGA